ncbi:hypothetical protein CPB86DRAFT_57831 [Serendipita vermifera]|nr:hypothetical protein CPB86DRAFT_57831 [Serendipita vermifera]
MPKPKRGTQASKRVANAKTNLANPSLHHPRQFPSEDNVRRTKLIMEKLDRKIEDLEGKIKKLQTQLQQLQQEKANHASYISPLKRLPTELLSEIIGIYIKQGGEITTAAGVCSRLRQVVLGMAGIWSKISLREIRTRKDSGYWYRGNRNYGSSIEALYVRHRSS